MLRGEVASASGDRVLLDVGGVGYDVTCPASTMDLLPTVGERATLMVETQVREDAIRLYGFATEVDREWFRTLLTVQGVGAKVALSMLGILSPHEVGAAIVAGDAKALGRTPGVGPKLANRIALELKDAADGLMGRTPVTATPSTDAMGPMAEEATSALVNLGYRRAEASSAVAAAAQANPQATTQALVRAALRTLAAK